MDHLDNLGAYRAIAKLGRGGTAQVFLAVRAGPSTTRKLVVLKRLRPEHLDETGIVEMFRDEARLSLEFNHPNIIHSYEFFEHGNFPCLAMEFLDGQPLSNILSGGQSALPLAANLRIIIEVLEALHYAHNLVGLDGTELNIVHRDVSPQNIIVTYDGFVKLVDFGIAKAASSSYETETGIFKGKLRYAAPEQVQGARIDHRVDIFAVGVILWEMVCGERFWGSGDSDLSVMNRLANGNVPMRGVGEGIPPAVRAVLARSLAGNPADRYATAEEMADALKQILASSPETDISSPQIGRKLCAMFATERAALRACVEKQLASIATNAPIALPTIALHASAGALQETSDSVSVDRARWGGAVAQSTATPTHPSTQASVTVDFSSATGRREEEGRRRGGSRAKVVRAGFFAAATSAVVAMIALAQGWGWAARPTSTPTASRAPTANPATPAVIVEAPPQSASVDAGVTPPSTLASSGARDLAPPVASKVKGGRTATSGARGAPATSTSTRPAVPSASTEVPPAPRPARTNDVDEQDPYAQGAR